MTDKPRIRVAAGRRAHLNIVPFPKPEPDECIVNTLTERLEQAKAGYLTELAFAATFNDGQVENWYSWPSPALQGAVATLTWRMASFATDEGDLSEGDDDGPASS